jgi:hypothetical protein
MFRTDIFQINLFAFNFLVTLQYIAYVSKIEWSTLLESHGQKCPLKAFVDDKISPISPAAKWQQSKRFKLFSNFIIHELQIFLRWPWYLRYLLTFYVGLIELLFYFIFCLGHLTVSLFFIYSILVYGISKFINILIFSIYFLHHF